MICLGKITLTTCTKKLLKFTGIFYKLRSRVRPHVLKMLYFNFVYPQLLYGIEVYANSTVVSLTSRSLYCSQQ